jgi:hypothetical protein
MAKHTGHGLQHPVQGSIPVDLVSAKTDLRNRLFLLAEKGVQQAFALRKARKYHPSPDVNLVGVGIGEKVTSGKPTGEMCVKVFVAKKYPKGRISRSHLIPQDIGGIVTDVEGVGYPKKFVIAQQRRHRPVPAGVSAGLDLHAVEYRFAGTLGVIVADRNDPKRFSALSNNHVLADENRVESGAGVVQPGTLDGGKNRDRVATLSRFVPLKFDNRRNWMDAALAVFDRGIAVDKGIWGIGDPSGSGKPSLNLVVRKSGRTTGLTEGIVRALNADILDIEYDQGMVRMDDVIVIRGTQGPFSKGGDSGSAIVDPQGRIVALLFAGSDVVTFAIPIQRILRRLQVRIAT